MPLVPTLLSLSCKTAQLRQTHLLTPTTVCRTTAAGLEVLGQLSGLHYLDIERAKTVTSSGLSYLTALTGLTQLRLPGTPYLRVLHFKSRPVRSI
jgi:hypothetical protein